MVPQIHPFQRPKAADYNPKLQWVRLCSFGARNVALIIVIQQTLLIHSNMWVIPCALGVLRAVTRLNLLILTTFLRNAQVTSSSYVETSTSSHRRVEPSPTSFSPS